MANITDTVQILRCLETSISEVEQMYVDDKYWIKIEDIHDLLFKSLIDLEQILEDNRNG